VIVSDKTLKKLEAAWGDEQMNGPKTSAIPSDRKLGETRALEAAFSDDAEGLRRALDELGKRGALRQLSIRAGVFNATPLMVAAMKGNLEAVKALADWSDLEARDAAGDTALAYAVSNDRLECAQWMQERGARSDTVDDKGGTLLHEAAEGGAAMAKWVASLPGVAKNAMNKNGEVAWVSAIIKEKEAAPALLGLCDPRMADGNGFTPLMAVSGNESGAVFHALLPLSDANARSRDGLTALMMAACHGFAGRVKTLLAWPGVDAGAERDSSANASDTVQTALEWALMGAGEFGGERDQEECVRLLSQATPLDVAERVLARVGKDAVPELFARVEAQKLKEAVAGAPIQMALRRAGGRL